MDKKSRDYEVCLCNHVTRGEVEDLIREKNIKSLKELTEAAKIGTRCGGCREDLDMILTDIWGEDHE